MIEKIDQSEFIGEDIKMRSVVDCLIEKVNELVDTVNGIDVKCDLIKRIQILEEKSK